MYVCMDIYKYITKSHFFTKGVQNMETTTKTGTHSHLPKKLISLLLVMIFVFNLLPVMAFAKPYSSSDGSIAELAKAIDFAVTTDTIGSYTVSQDGNTITDNSNNSSIWNIAMLFYNVYKTELSKVSDNKNKYPDAIFNTIIGELKVKSANTDKTKVVELLKALSHYGAYTYCGQKNTGSSYDYQISTPTLKVTVKRSQDSALSDYRLESFNQLEDFLSNAFNKSFSYSINSGAAYSNRKWSLLTYKYNYQYNYISSIGDFSLSDSVNKQNAQKIWDALNNYISMCDQLSTVPTVNELLAANTAEQLSELNKNCNSVKTNAESYSVALNYWLSIYYGKISPETYYSDNTAKSKAQKAGSAAQDKFDQYAANCYAANIVKVYETDVEAMNQLIAAGYASYDLSTNDKIKAAEEKWKKAKALYDTIMEASADVKALLTEYLNWDEAAATSFITNFYDAIEKAKLDVVIGEINKYVATLDRYADDSVEFKDYGTHFDLTEVKESDIKGKLAEFEAYEKVFSDTKNYVGANYSDYIKTQLSDVDKQFITSAKWELARRGVDSAIDDAIVFFKTAILFDTCDYSTSYYYLLKDATENKKALNDVISKNKATFGEQATKDLLVAYGGITEGNKDILEEIDAYIDRLCKNGAKTIKTELEAVNELMAVNDNVINLTNYALFETYYNSIHKLYDWLEPNYKLPNDCGFTKDEITALESFLDSYSSFMDKWELKKLEKVDLSDNYPTRLGYDSDYARKSDEDFKVTKENLQETVNKLDTIISSDVLMKLLGQGDDVDLQTFIKNAIGEYLFNDEMVNTIFAMLYPTITEMLDGMVTDLIGSLAGGDDPDAVQKLDDGGIKLDIAKLLGDDATIKLNGDATIYIDQARFKGKVDTYPNKDFVNVFEELGINIYPASLAKVFKEDSVLKDVFKADMGRSWDAFREKDADGMPIKNSDVSFDIDWGIDSAETFDERYAKFCEALGKIFNPIKPILATLFGETIFKNTTDKAAFVNVDASTKILVTISFKAGADVGLTLSIAPVQGFKSIWIPLLEDLGLNAPDAPYSFNPITGKESTEEMVSKLFDPILALINNLSEAPVDNILSILPNLAYIVSFDGINKLIAQQKLTVDYELSVEIVEKESEGLAKIAGYLNLDELLVRILNKNLEPMELKVGDILDIGEFLGCDMSDINSIVRMLFDALGIRGFEMPIVDPAQLITCGTPKAGISSARLSGKRDYIEADKADVFFTLFNWAMQSLGNQSLISGLLGMIQHGDDDAPALSSVITGLLKELSDNKDKALCTIVELFNPQEYANAALDTFNDEAYGQYVKDKEIEGFNDASAVYLENANNWSHDKAEYVANNVEDFFEAILSIAGMDKADIKALLDGEMKTIFTNNVISSLVGTLCGLDDLLPVGDDIKGIIKDKLGIDVSAWNTAFGYLFDDDDTTNTKVEGFTDLSYEQNEDGEYAWKLRDKFMSDGDKLLFIDVLLYLVKDFEPIVGLLLNDTDFVVDEDENPMFVIPGNNGYKEAILPLFTALGIGGKTAEKYQECYKDNPIAGLKCVIYKLFNKLDKIVANPASEIVEILPKLVYFLEGNGLSVVIRNLLHPLLVLVDTVRPLVDLDIDKLVKGLVGDLLGEDSVLKAEYLNGLSINDLRLETVLAVLDKVVKGVLGEGFEILPVLSPALRTFSMNEKVLDAADGITVLVCAVLELLEYENNAYILDKYLVDNDILHKTTSGILPALKAVFNAPVTEMMQPDWAYTFKLAAGYADDDDLAYNEDINYYIVNALNEEGKLDLSRYHTINYLNYDTNWTEDAAKYLAENLDDIALQILKAVIPNAPKDAKSIDEVITALNFYSAETIDMIAGMLKDLLGNLVVEDENGRNTAILDVLGQIIGGDDANITALLDFDASKYFLSDDDESDEDSFIRALKDMLTPAAKLLDLMFLGQDIEYFNASGIIDGIDGKPIITLHGAEGYAYGLVPLIEALGGECEDVDKYYSKDYDEEFGNYKCALKDDVNSITMLGDVLKSVCGIVDKIYAAPVDTVLDMIPNLLYFINSNGLTAAVNNTIRAVSNIANTVLGNMESFKVEESDETTPLNALVKSLTGIDLGDLGVDQIIAIIYDLTSSTAEDGKVIPGLHLSPISELLETFFIGRMEYYTSANGHGAFKMVYNEDEDKADMLTILLSFVIETIKYDEDVAAYLDNLLGTGDLISQAIECYKGYEVNYVKLPYDEIKWAYSNLYNEDPENPVNDPTNPYNIYSTIDRSQLFANNYGPLYTEEMANDIGENFDEFLDATIELLGVNIGGKQVDSLTDLLDSLIGTTIYTKDNIIAILNVIKGFMDQLTAVPASEHVKQLLNMTLGINIGLYDDYLEDPSNLTNFKDGDRDGFVKSIKMLLNPLYPVLNWLLANEDISFFNSKEEGKKLIVLYGAEGYKYGIIPVLEALGCKDDDIMIADDYYDAIKDNADAVFDAILTPLLNRLDEILEDPANEVLDLLPNLAYFINSNGLDTCWKNILHAVFGLLKELEPVVGTDLSTMLDDIVPDDLTFDSLVDMALGMIAVGGYGLSALRFDELNELTTGKLEKYLSKNGLDAYRMVHVIVEDDGKVKEDRTNAETVTALMRIIAKFIANDQNAETIKKMISDNENITPEAKKFYCGIIDMIFEYAQSDSGMDTLLYTIYQLYYGINIAVTETSEFLNDFNDRYEYVYDTLNEDDDPAVQYAAQMFEQIFNGSDAGNIINQDGLIPNGFISFFQSFINLFSQFFAWIKQIFQNIFN